MSAPLPFSEVSRLDSELVRLGRGASAVRLTLGAALDALSSSGGHHELGFSSLEAYARERCERTGRWAADTRALARMLERLPQTRDALRSGGIGWSTAELLARHVAPETEVAWLERARETTVRELRALLASATGNETSTPEADEPETKRTLRVSVTREDGWLFECTRKAAEASGGSMTSDRLLSTLLAEAYVTLLEVVPESARAELYEIEELESDLVAESKAQRAWCAERRRWQDEAEGFCERRWSSTPEHEGEIVKECPPHDFAGTAETLDREIRRLSSELAERDLALGIVAESARKADVWRRLGFASESQYARERVGVSLSSLKARRILAARAGRVPGLAAALATGRIGYEAAYLLSRIVTPRTAADWIQRAERRTVKHLREEIEAAELFIRMGLGTDQPPLDEKTFSELSELERFVVSGELLEGAANGAGNEAVQLRWSQMSGDWRVNGVGQMSGGRSAVRLRQRFGRVVLRWVVRDETARFWHALERVFSRVRSHVCPVPMSFIGFLCANFCRVWLPSLWRERLTESGEVREYFGVYRRDVFRCTSRVCARRDITPHHLTFRSHGGGDEDENVASLCVWCHLCGVHEGRIAAAPPASRIRWKIGRNGTLFVEGRVRGPTA